MKNINYKTWFLKTIMVFLAVKISAQPWQKGGNAGSPNLPILGTTGNEPLRFVTRCANNERMRITPAGWLGFGTNNPQSFTHIHNPATGLFASNFTQWTNNGTTAGANRGLMVGNVGTLALVNQMKSRDHLNFQNC